MRRFAVIAVTAAILAALGAGAAFAGDAADRSYILNKEAKAAASQKAGCGKCAEAATAESCCEKCCACQKSCHCGKCTCKEAPAVNKPGCGSCCAESCCQDCSCQKGCAAAKPSNTGGDKKCGANGGGHGGAGH